MADLPQLALSIRQPWAWAIINAGKDVENRSWSTRVRGLVCIHAAQGCSWEEWDDALFFMMSLQDLHPPLRHQIVRGGIVGMAEIVDCVDVSESPWFVGRYGFVLRNARQIDFIPVKGTLGFFDWRRNLSGAPT